MPRYALSWVYADMHVTAVLLQLFPAINLLPPQHLSCLNRQCRYMNWGAEHGMLNDYVIILAIAAFWAASGHVNACAYVMAAQWAPPGGGDRAGGLMALAFQVSCLASLLLAAALQHVVFPQPA